MALKNFFVLYLCKCRKAWPEPFALYMFYCLCFFFFCSCAPTPVIETPELYQTQLNDWIIRVESEPRDPEAIKNLAIFYVQKQEYAKANRYIYEAMDLFPGDPALMFYKGLYAEFFGNLEEALNNYKKYDQVPVSSQYRELMEGRYNWLLRKKAFSDIDELVKNEASISDSAFSDKVFAVFPLIYRGIDQQYVPLSRGFSEMISIDLAKLKQFTILERVRIQAVLDEIKFAQSELVDQSTAPRAGKLLRAGVIVSGDYDISENDALKINLGSWETQKSQRKSWVNKKGVLKDLFVLQKELVFEFLQQNNIELTQTQKESIAYLPTQNLEAFLSFSRGLLKEDAGDFEGAASYFQRAMELDPDFGAAGEKFQSSQSINKNGGEKEQILTKLKSEDSIVKNENIQLVQNRIESITNKISSNFIQGIDSRNPAQEISVDSELPLPPPPPALK